VQFYGSVLRHDGKFKMWYIAADDQSLKLLKQGRGFSGLRPAYAESDDSMHWRGEKRFRFENGFLNDQDLILPRVSFEQGGLFRWHGMYHLPGQQIWPWVWQPDGKPIGRAMALYRSRDLLHWESASALGFMRGPAIGRVGRPSLDEEAHLASSVWQRGNVLLGVYGLWHGAKEWQDRRIDLGLMISNDGIHFREPIRECR